MALHWMTWASTVAKRIMLLVRLQQPEHFPFIVRTIDTMFHSIRLFDALSTAPPKFTVRPKTQISEIGKEALFECQASGYPKPTIFWSIEGNRTLMFPGMKYGNVEISITPEGRSVLSISKVQRYDAGKIIVCSAVNSVSSVSSRVVLSLNTQDDRPPPIITLGPTNQTLPLKSVAALACKSIGHPTPIISWYRDGIPVVLSERITLSEDGTLTITDLKKDDDAGLYTCVSRSCVRQSEFGYDFCSIY